MRRRGTLLCGSAHLRGSARSSFRDRAISPFCLYGHQRGHVGVRRQRHGARARGPIACGDRRAIVCLERGGCRDLFRGQSRTRRSHLAGRDSTGMGPEAVAAACGGVSPLGSSVRRHGSGDSRSPHVRAPAPGYGLWSQLRRLWIRRCVRCRNSVARLSRSCTGHSRTARGRRRARLRESPRDIESRQDCCVGRCSSCGDSRRATAVDARRIAIQGSASGGGIPRRPPSGGAHESLGLGGRRRGTGPALRPRAFAGIPGRVSTANRTLR